MVWVINTLQEIVNLIPKRYINIQQIINPPEKTSEEEGQKESLGWDNIKNNKERKEEIKRKDFNVAITLR